jgi:formylglycine-generating enzyme required for sulfatase activity
MGFKDFIKPGWKHPDPARRLKTVQRMTAPAVLADVYKNDPDYTVRKAAVERMHDQKQLTEIVKNETDVIIRLIAVWKIKDTNLLHEIAQNDQDKDIRQVAAWKSTNPGLAQQAKNAASYAERKAGILGLSPEGASGISDQLLLKDIAMHDRDAYLRAEAVNKISSQTILTDIIKKSRDLNTREAAVSQITDQELLLDIAKYHSAEKRAKLYFKLQIAIVTIIVLAVIGLMVLHRTSVSNSKHDLFAGQKALSEDAYNYLIQDKKSFIVFLLVKVNSPDYNTVDRSLAYLQRLKPDIHELVPALLKALPGKDNAIKRKIGATIVEMGPSAVPVLIKVCVDGKSADVRLATIKLLNKIGVAKKEYVPSLLKLLNSKHSDIKMYTLKKLGQIGPDAAAAVPFLIKELGVRNEHKAYALETLVKIGKPAVPSLINKLGDSNDEIKKDAARTLGKIGPEAVAAVPELIKTFSECGPNIRQAAAEALGNIGPAAQAAVPNLIKALGDLNSSIRLTASKALDKIGPEAKNAVPDLIKILGDQRASVRQAATEILGKIGPNAKNAVPVLIKSLNDHDFKVRHSATQALGKIGSNAKNAVPVLIKSLNDHDFKVRHSATQALGKIGSNAKNAVPVLIKSLNDHDFTIRQAAIQALGKIGPDAKNAVPTLITKLKETDENTRKFAVESLTQIGKYAVISLSDRILLTDIAKNAKEYAVRNVTYRLMTKNDLSKLEDQAYLSDIAKHDSDGNVRMVAVSRLSGLALVYVAPGSFQMGSSRYNSEKPVHQVTISQGYGLGKYPVTQNEYQSIIGRNPSELKGGNRPVERVSWHDAVKFCEKLTSRERVAGRLPAGFKYRLPTEAEWEFAARGGVKSRGYKYSGSDNIDSVAWYDSNSGDKTHKVGTKNPNELGIYDMSGNVWEWCLDDWYDNYKGAPSNGSRRGDGTGSLRVYRGGSWSHCARYCRSAIRNGNSPGSTRGTVGFRVAFVCSSL